MSSKHQDITDELNLSALTISTPSYQTWTSSLKAPFIVVTSEGGFLFKLSTTTATSEASVTSQSVDEMIDVWENEGITLLADLEGENHGLGGELHCAQFLPTSVYDGAASNVVPGSVSYSPSSSPSSKGLLLDAKSVRKTPALNSTQPNTRLTPPSFTSFP